MCENPIHPESTGNFADHQPQMLLRLNSGSFTIGEIFFPCANEQCYVNLSVETHLKEAHY